jgi:sulfide:quinone oxidoreductase
MALDITKHTETFSSCHQITADDVDEIVKLGYKTIINARPDHEGGHAQPTSNSIQIAAEKAGLFYKHIPVIPNNINETDIEACANFLTDAPTPVLGYCKTGMRATSLYKSTQ